MAKKSFGLDSALGERGRDYISMPTCISPRRYTYICICRYRVYFVNVSKIQVNNCCSVWAWRRSVGCSDVAQFRPTALPCRDEQSKGEGRSCRQMVAGEGAAKGWAMILRVVAYPCPAPGEMQLRVIPVRSNCKVQPMPKSIPIPRLLKSVAVLPWSWKKPESGPELTLNQESDNVIGDKEQDRKQKKWCVGWAFPKQFCFMFLKWHNFYFV